MRHSLLSVCPFAPVSEGAQVLKEQQTSSEEGGGKVGSTGFPTRRRRFHIWTNNREWISVAPAQRGWDTAQWFCPDHEWPMHRGKIRPAILPYSPAGTNPHRRHT